LKSEDELEERNQSSKSRVRIIHLGIVDYLQSYNFFKKMEFFLKGFGHSQSYKHSLSAVPPEIYSTRFADFLKMKVFTSTNCDDNLIDCEEEWISKISAGLN
jgi:Phosphatidylinositol-4-phosphate 5-Kinase